MCQPKCITIEAVTRFHVVVNISRLWFTILLVPTTQLTSFPYIIIDPGVYSTMIILIGRTILNVDALREENKGEKVMNDKRRGGNMKHRSCT